MRACVKILCSRNSIHEWSRVSSRYISLWRWQMHAFWMPSRARYEPLSLHAYIMYIVNANHIAFNVIVAEAPPPPPTTMGAADTTRCICAWCDCNTIFSAIFAIRRAAKNSKNFFFLFRFRCVVIESDFHSMCTVHTWNASALQRFFFVRFDCRCSQWSLVSFRKANAFMRFFVAFVAALRLYRESLLPCIDTIATCRQSSLM